MRFRLIALTLFMFLISAGAFSAPTATVTLPNPTQRALLDTDVTFCVRFENTGNAVGFGPYVDLRIDHAGGGTTPALCDGLSYVSAKLVHTNPSLPLTAVATPQVAPPCGTVTTFSHPWGFPPAPSTTGEEFVRIELPFGSFQNQQAPLDIEITAHVHPQADVNSPLTIKVNGGYRWGPPYSSNVVLQTIVPEVVIIEKTFLGPENEIVSGPNFPGQYQIDIDVAPGQTISNALLQDCALPPGVVFVSTGSNCFTQTWPLLTAGHYTIPAPFHALEPPAILACSRSINNLAELISGMWTPTPPSNPPDPPIDFALRTPKPSSSVTIEERTLAIQKRVTSGAPPVPGGTLGYQLDFQISGYHRFGNIVVIDTLSDGQSLSGLVNVSVMDRFGSMNVSLPVPSSCITMTTKNVAQKYICPPGKKEPCTTPGAPTNVGITGGTRLTIDISCIMKSSLLSNPFGNGVLTGDQVPLPGTSTIPATGMITFNVTINDQFSSPHPPGDPFVDKHDPVLNAASITGVLASNANVKNPPLIGPTCTDATYSCLSVPGDTLSKKVYAKNQTILNPPANPVGSPLPQFSVGDTITYQLSKTIPTGDAEHVTITDWFALPLLQVPGVLPAIAACTYSGPNVVPPTANAVACYVAPLGSTHTMAPVAPNALLFDFGTFNNTANTPALFEIYVTLTVSNDPRPDGLHLTNHAQECEKNTFGVVFCQTAIAQFELTEPMLRIGKAIICPDPVCPEINPSKTARIAGVPDDLPMIDPNAPKKPQWKCAPLNACPKFTGTINGISTPLLANTTTNVDANDEVTFAVVVENHGNGPYGAHGVKIDDVLSGLPATFITGSLCVRYGDGTPVLYTPTTGAFPITLTNPLLPPGSGKNVVVLTFRVKMPPPAQAEIGKCLTNTATIVFYTNTVGGSNFVSSGLVDPGVATATACIRPKVLTKEIVATSETHTSETPVRPVAIGEIVRFNIKHDIPEGFTNTLTITDPLPIGLTYLGPSAYTFPIGIMPPPAQPAVSGQTLTFTFGPIQNNYDSPECEILAIEFPVLVGNVSQNVNGQVLANGFSASSTAGSLGTFTPTNDTKVQIVEPRIIISKSVAPASVGPGGSVSYTINLTSNGSTDAFDVKLNDAFPSALANFSLAVTGPVISPLGCATFTPPVFAGLNLTSTAPKMPPGCSATFTVTGRLLPGLCPPNVTNQANVTYSSLPGLKGTTANLTQATVPGNPTDPDGERVYGRRAVANFACAPGCDFSIVKTAVKVNTPSGIRVTYTITANVTPPGIDCPSCNPINIVDSLPPQLTNLTVGPLPQYWTHTLVGSLLTLTTLSQPPAMPATFTVSGTVVPPPPPTMTNCARITCTDGNPANNNSCVTLQLP